MLHGLLTLTANGSAVGFVGELPSAISSHAKNKLKGNKISVSASRPNKFNHVLATGFFENSILRILQYILREKQFYNFLSSGYFYDRNKFGLQAICLNIEVLRD